MPLLLPVKVPCLCISAGLSWVWLASVHPPTNALRPTYQVYIHLPTKAMHNSLEAMWKDEHMHLHAEETIPDGPAAPEVLNAIEQMRDSFKPSKITGWYWQVLLAGWWWLARSVSQEGAFSSGFPLPCQIHSGRPGCPYVRFHFCFG